ncbi:MAG TPA: hypothetical protein VNF99_18145 [Stellaceae bacterium]|nr:hypothetical protein [Stellaceae bacterium]
MIVDEMPRFADDHPVSDKPEELKQQEHQKQPEHESQAITAARPNGQVAAGRRPLFRN